MQPTIAMLDLINVVCTSVGYPTTATVTGSEDPTYAQMLSLLNDAGLDLLMIHDWPKQVRTHQFSVVADYSGQKEKGFDLPTDFYSFNNDTHWNESTQWPLLGPATPSQWRTLMVRNFVSQFSIIWRNKEDQFYVASPPDSAQTLSFEYQSSAWVQDGTDPLIFKTITDNNSDILLLPPYLLKQFTRAKWLEAKGFKSEAAYRDFYLALRRRMGAEEGATVLSLNNRPTWDYPIYGA